MNHQSESILYGSIRKYRQAPFILPLFEAEVKKNPHHPAAIYQHHILTYQELNQQSNQLAHYLRKQGLKNGSIVAVSMERSLSLVIAIYGILKAGMAYLPIDTNYPLSRIRYMLEDASSPLLLTHHHIRNDSNKKALTQFKETLFMDEIWDNILFESNENLSLNLSSENPAYLIYTSGSTGSPKGVLNSHRGLFNRLCWMQEEFQLTKQDAVLQKTPFTFDVSVWEFFWPLLFGAKLIIAEPDSHKNPKQLAKIVRENNVSIIHFVPSMLKIFLEQINLEHYTSLRTVICSGEALSPSLQETFFKKSHAALYNLYGPTEASIDVTCWRCQPKSPLGVVPIGKPIANTQLYILDTELKPVQFGQTGELYIGGTGVAIGYINQPALTAERFIQNPFQRPSSDRLYKTGDLVRQLPDGNLVFISRVDDQVKIRGYRIELGEVETTLNRYPAILQSAVVVSQDKRRNHFLAAFLVCRKKTSLRLTELKTFLSNNLPDYMIPSLFHQLELLPLTASGKIDRQALSKIITITTPPENRQMIRSLPFLAPKTKDEKLMAIIWSDVLHKLAHTISINDDFFELGGHSLSALHMLIKMRLCFTTGLVISDIFKNPTIRQLVKRISKIRQTRDSISTLPFKKHAARKSYPLSYSQELIWRHQVLAPDQPLYNEQMNIRFPSPVDPVRLEKSLNEIIKQHDIFRTTIHSSHQGVYQKITPYRFFELIFTDLQSFPKSQRIKKAIQLATFDAQKPFQLSSEPLFRFRLIQLEDNDFRLFAVFHHLIIDGVTLFQLFNKTLEALYYNLTINTDFEEKREAIYQYTDFILWEKQSFESQQLLATSHLNYWQQYLNQLPKLNLPYQHPPPTKQADFRGGRLYLSYSNKLLKKLTLLSRQENITLYTLLLAAFNLLLYRYTHQTDISVGTIISDRHLLETESMMGSFLNTVIIRTQLNDPMTFQQLLSNTWGNLKNTFSHQSLPFQMLLPFLANQTREKGLMPINTAFVCEPEFYDSPHGWMTSQLEVHTNSCKFDLTFGLEVKKNGLVGRVEYNVNRFDHWFIQQMISHYEVILQSITEDIHQPISTIPILTAQDKRKLLIEWNGTRTDYPHDKTLHQLFEEQAARTPQNIAIIFEEKKLTYRELNEKSNQLAHYLRKQGVSTETLVAICLDRCLEMVIAILAILKAGGAYVPIDPKQPNKRVQFILEDTKAAILLTQQSLLKTLSSSHPKIIALDSMWELIAQEKGVNLAPNAGHYNLAYVIYTSGSTGKQKGVLIEHSGVVNMILEQKKLFKITKKSIVAGFSSLSFDASVSEIFITLSSGATLQLISRKEGLGNLLGQLQLRGINILTLPPSAARLLPMKALCHLKLLVLAGESADTLLHALSKPSYCSLINAYGPTEASVCSTIFPLPPGNSLTHIPIGKPLNNVHCYVLNPSLQLVPIGTIGELHIGGVGLARGYLNQPELTKEKFIPNPFGEGRLYKTGDLVRFHPDGNLEFIGRIDDQVKIRGFRIECGEIEANLMNLPEIQQSVVVAKNDQAGDKYLAAYLVTHKKITPSAIKDFLKERLPDYMIPLSYTFLDQLPLNTNGKVDKKALPEPEKIALLPQKIIEPKTTIEKQLLTIWHSLLQFKTLSITEDFFDLGGHSLKAIQLLSQLNQKYKIALTINDILQYSTIEKLAQRISAIKKSIREKTQHKPSQQTTLPILVPLKKTGHKTPLFLIHPIGGTVFCYLPLTKYFDPDRPLFGLQDPSIILGKPLFNTLEEMSQYYIQAIRTVQPKGPYLLGGLSSGATMAIEMAKQLASLGEPTRFIALLDGWATYPKSIQNKISLNESLSRHHQQWRDQFTASSVADLEKLFTLQWHRLLLLKKYQLQPIQHPLTLFKAKELLSYFENIKAPHNFWDHHALLPITVFEVEGNHETILQEPHIATWAYLLNNCLDEHDSFRYLTNKKVSTKETKKAANIPIINP